MSSLRAPALDTRTVVVTIVLAVVVAVTGVLWFTSDDRPPYDGGPVSLSTGVPEGVYHRYGELLAPRLADDLKTKVTLDPSSGSVDNLRRIIAGRDTFAISTTDAVAALDQGRLRAVARLFDDYVQLIVPAGSPVQRLPDLRGKRVSVGPPASGVELVTRRLLVAGGLDPDKDVIAEHTGLGDAVEAFRRGDIDAFFWSGGLPTKAVAELATDLKVRMVPLGEYAKKLRADYGPVYREAVVPGDAYDLSDGTDVSTVAVPNLLVTSTTVDRDLVRQVTGTVMRSR
jgi:TRAP transporter TAXI family solute receptor